jgi:hypothetical protein
VVAGPWVPIPYVRNDSPPVSPGLSKGSRRRHLEGILEVKTRTALHALLHDEGRRGRLTGVLGTARLGDRVRYLPWRAIVAPAPSARRMAFNAHAHSRDGKAKLAGLLRGSSISVLVDCKCLDLDKA